MPSLEELLNTKLREGERVDSYYTPEERRSYGEWKRFDRESAYTIIDHEAERVFSDGDALYQFLFAQSKLMHLSASNVLLLRGQIPVSDIDTYDGWLARDNPVRKGESGLMKLGQNQRIQRVFDISQTVNPEPSVSFPLATDYPRMILAIGHNSPAEIRLVNKTSALPAYSNGVIHVPNIQEAANEVIPALETLYILGCGTTAVYREQLNKPANDLANACGGAFSNIVLGTLPTPDRLQEIVSKAAGLDARMKKALLSSTREIGEKILDQIEPVRDTYRSLHRKAMGTARAAATREERYKDTARAR
jgi:hypothetical protein